MASESETKTVPKRAASEQPNAKQPASKKAKTVDDAPTDESKVLQHGRIFFLCKPKVDVTHPKSVDDVARFHMVLVPHDAPDDEATLIIVGRKFVPNPANGRQPIWAFVKEIDADDVLPHLKADTYETKTRGTRTVHEDQLIAEGAYALIYAPGDTPSQARSLMAYALEEPVELGDVQKAFKLSKEGHFGVCVKNPTVKGGGNSQRQAGLKEPAEFPEALLSKFQGRRWLPFDTSDFLKHKNAELLLLNQTDELGDDAAAEQVKDEADEGVSDADVQQHELDVASKRLWDELRAKKTDVTIAPISEDWAVAENDVESKGGKEKQTKLTFDQ